MVVPVRGRAVVGAGAAVAQGVRTSRTPVSRELVAVAARVRRGASGAAILLAALVVVGWGCDRGGEEPGGAGAVGVSAFSPVRVFGRAGTSPGTFYQPRAMASDGRWLFVADRTGRLQKLDLKTGQCVAWWLMPEYQNGMPTGLTIGPAAAGVAAASAVKVGTPVLYVADTHYHRVLVYPLDVERFASAGGDEPTAGSVLMAAPAPRCEPPILAQFGELGTGPGQFVYPTNVLLTLAADGATVERIYVNEYGDHDRVSVFGPDFKFLFSFGTQGSSATAENVQFDRPQAAALDPSGAALWITDARNHRVGVFTLDGGLVRWLSGTEGGGPRYNLPWSIQSLGDGTALIVDRGASRVRRVDMASGVTRQTWGRPGRREGELAEPWGLVVAEREVLVADTTNQRVQVFGRP